MTLTFKLDLDGVKTNKCAKCVGQDHFVQKLLCGHRHTWQHSWSTWTAKVNS